MSDTNTKDVVKGCSFLSIMQIANILMFAIYITSIVQCYISGNGLIWTFVIAIPVIGQLLWAGVMYGTSGIFNSYFYLLFATLIVYGIARMIGHSVTNIDEKHNSSD